ncbi:hypothetical protein ACFPOI_37980 [Nonomuraea angiospora]|uniref:Uncharacterized protein n=1 Tax=Nonomuraea angiospora TaxID=46172 RepID=A0ABR9M2B9_9ACTN|nr:hypothetical protein [Nonomuraea angiospora]MBE1586481.1 hypothetical protein [Nonomuraea angiospora]
MEGQRGSHVLHPYDGGGVPAGDVQHQIGVGARDGHAGQGRNGRPDAGEGGSGRPDAGPHRQAEGAGGRAHELAREGARPRPGVRDEGVGPHAQGHGDDRTAVGGAGQGDEIGDPPGHGHVRGGVGDPPGHGRVCGGVGARSQGDHRHRRGQPEARGVLRRAVRQAHDRLHAPAPLGVGLGAAAQRVQRHVPGGRLEDPPHLLAQRLVPIDDPDAAQPLGRRVEGDPLRDIEALRRVRAYEIRLNK